MGQKALVWFRRDLRHFDHAALYHALRDSEAVFCVFVFDRDILDALPSRVDRRVGFIHAALIELDAALRAQGGGLIVRHGRAVDDIPALAADLDVDTVYVNRDYEPQAIARDSAVANALAAEGRALRSFKDQVIFEQDEILTKSRTPYSVFTPYRRAWQAALTPDRLQSYAVADHIAGLCPPPAGEIVPTMDALGFSAGNLADLALPTGMSGGELLFDDFRDRIDAYRLKCDFPAQKGVSYLSAHLRFGTVSIRQLASYAWFRGGQGAETWLSELIWREFYQMVLWHRPEVVDRCYRSAYDALQWDDWPDGFAAWCEGRTGYPLVDAAMRQLNQSGYMHNRLRMIAASFLTKDLGIDWRAGERYFAAQLIDYDLAANNGGWQWAASTGCDAQPWFRIFNPITQSQKFDPAGAFIRRYVPELAAVPDRDIHAPWMLPPLTQSALGIRMGETYPAPMVDHAEARARTLARFRAVTSVDEAPADAS
ncbi:MAG TPA: deoxyribodipyrimidine photo-lyase [Denitromonas sp.]|uniref:cryptochrome/photolyase family protein n=1 Tax=Denitromonas sp. TaxID=2734609 RepID=UPI001E0845AE|nr:deoxyribodipyrimidine photo-lyase [Rhodocyclaceae bacterium]MCP5221272.1 deoxyribodipyrimidine photo-lyase [Zoogloeaceae bacterium]HPR08156.1 deoxyribodipyrimidine photo-lyase [Denitromonas sp.]HQU89051.1 deoxyribodipyrimidine photo-lyase [Denitromonas sp.]HQV14496.1 deoxyribodipyrimidine photo-lyase [Denitromonas sp.]